MGFATVATALLAAVSSVSALSPPLPGVIGGKNTVNGLQQSTNKTQTLGSGYILQFHTEGLSKRDLEDVHSVFHKRAQDNGLSYTTRQTYNNHGTFVGISVDLKQGTIDDLKNLENVAQVWPVQKIGRPLAAVQTGSGQSVAGVHSRGTKDTNASFTLPHITGNIRPNQPLTMAGVDKVHSLGFKGKGVKIAAIDTGVDYLHPALGGCFGEGCKVAFGYDFVGDDYPSSTVESPTPLTQCLLGGHGTHVMGIIGMEDPKDVGFGLLGVAPEATLGMYRVFGCSDDTESDIIIQAMLKAQTDGADIITMSIGSASPYESSDPFETVTTALVEAGIAVFAATGNDAGLYGSGEGIYWPSAPGTGPDVFAVGSVDNTVYPLTYEFADSNGRRLRYSSVLPIDGPRDGLTVLVVNEGSETKLDLMGCYEEDYINAAANVTDPSKVILAVLNGGCLSAAKGEVAAEYGFKYLVSYYTDGWDLAYIWDEYDVVDPDYNFNITPIIVTAADSTTILDGYKRSPGSYKLYFSDTNYGAVSTPYDHGGFMSNYSSWGPTLDVENIKPQLSAPGANILSTWPLDPLQKGYAILSGTSMATPFMAACFALLREANPHLTINESLTLLQESGSLTRWYYDERILSPPLQQGSGMVNIYNAITYQSIVTPTQVTLDTSSHTHPVKGQVTITNRSPWPRVYTFSHEEAGLAQWEFYEGPRNQLYPIYATVEFDKNFLFIEGGKSAVLTFTVTPPYVADPVYLPIYGGYIIVHEGAETYTIPYIGQPWDETWAGTIISEWVMTSAYIQPDMLLIAEKVPSIRGYSQYIGVNLWTSSPLGNNATFPMGRYGYFGVYWQLSEKADYARFDLVPANVSFKPTLYGYDPKVVAIPKDELIYPANLTTTNILGVPVVYTLETFDAPVNNTDSDDSFWVYSMPENKVPDADYRVLMRVLPQGGNKNNAWEYQSWLSGILRINRTAEQEAALPYNEIYDDY